MNHSEIIGNIGQHIYEMAFQENQQLSKLGKGIFFMPELALAYLIGKDIAEHQNDIFGSTSFNWQREIKGAGGLTDIILEYDNSKKVYIELKMSNTYHSYEKDIIKLSQIKEAKCIKLFCALIDVFKSVGPNDERIKNMDSLVSIKKVLQSEPFDTKYDRYSQDMQCIVGIWQV